MEVGSFEMMSNPEGDEGNLKEITIEIRPEDDDDGSYNAIQVQSPGGGFHFLEGLSVANTTSQRLTNLNPHMAYAHGSTVIVENHDGQNSGHQNGSSTMTGIDIEDVIEEVICGPGYQVVDLGQNETWKVFFAYPKQDYKEVETPYCLDTKQKIPVHISDSRYTTSISMATTTHTGIPTFVSNDSQLQLLQNHLVAVDGHKNDRPKRKAALKAIAARKTAKKEREKNIASRRKDRFQKVSVSRAILQSTASLSKHPETIVDFDVNQEIGNAKTDSELPNRPESAPGQIRIYPKPKSGLMLEDHNGISEVKVHEEFCSSEEKEMGTRRCLVCLRRRRFTEDVFVSSKQLYHRICVLIAHLNIQVKGTPENTGLCPECMNTLQKWHIFSCAIVKRQQEAWNVGVEVIQEPISYQTFKSVVYKNYTKMAIVKEVYRSATHTQYTRRHLNDTDWDFFCDHLCQSDSVKSQKSEELKKFLTSREKLSHIYCIKCQKLIPNGIRGYTKHMNLNHHESPVMFPCDICGETFPEKDMAACTQDYYSHWISHFYFNKCDDCGKRYPTKQALDQHRHAVHKSQVKYDECGKYLANKMNLDLHVLRHQSENVQKKIEELALKSQMASHNDERPWKCDRCDATFKVKAALVSHRNCIHFNLKSHVCSICGHAFKSANAFRDHVKIHEGRKDYKCEVCLKEFYSRSSLTSHKSVHQTAKDFLCDTCGKAYKTRKSLEEHVNIHTGEKPYWCPVCGRQFRGRSNLYKHKKIHKDPKPSSNQALQNGIAPSNDASGEHQVLGGNSNPIRTAIATQEADGTVTLTLDRGTIIRDHNGTPFVVNIATAGNTDHEMTPVSININSGDTATFLSPPFQAAKLPNPANMVQLQTMTMQQIEEH